MKQIVKSSYDEFHGELLPLDFDSPVPPRKSKTTEQKVKEQAPHLHRALKASALDAFIRRW